MSSSPASLLRFVLKPRQELGFTHFALLPLDTEKASIMAVDPLAIPANNIICSLTDPEGRSLGASLDLPQDAGPKELHLLINSLLQNVSARFLNRVGER